MSDERPLTTDGDRIAWLDRPGSIDLLVKLVYGTCALLLVIGAGFAFFSHAYDHAHYGFEKLFFFHGAFGFASFVFLVFVAKGMRRILQRDEGYYDDLDASPSGRGSRRATGNSSTKPKDKGTKARNKGRARQGKGQKRRRR